MKTARNTTPHVMTEPKLPSRKAKRSGLWKPAVASTISSSRPITTVTGAMTRPMRIMFTACGQYLRSRAEVRKAPPPKPARKR